MLASQLNLVRSFKNYNMKTGVLFEWSKTRKHVRNTPTRNAKLPKKETFSLSELTL